MHNIGHGLESFIYGCMANDRVILDIPRQTRASVGSPTFIGRASVNKQLGKTDQIVEWLKPAEKPSWMIAQQFAALPDSIVVAAQEPEELVAYLIPLLVTSR